MIDRTHSTDRLVAMDLPRSKFLTSCRFLRNVVSSRRVDVLTHITRTKALHNIPVNDCLHRSAYITGDIHRSYHSLFVCNNR